MTIHSLRSVIGRDVVAIDNADDVGSVKHVVVSPSARCIERLHIDGRGKRSMFAEWSELESFGTDRVMLKHAGATEESDIDRDRDAAKGNLDILDARILDTAGFEHGVVRDVTFDGDSGAIVEVASSQGEQFAATTLRSFGSYALVIEESAT